MSLPTKFEGWLACPDCRSSLQYSNASFSCLNCHNNYLKKEGKIYFRSLEESNKLFSNKIKFKDKDGLIILLKSFSKKWPKFFLFLYKIAAPFVGKSAEKFAKEFSGNEIVLNLGSGAKIVREGVVNIDYDAFPSVDIVTDINKLPFRSNSVDGVICESVFEHLLEPEKTVAEIFRILQPQGKLYVVTPFMLGYHASPNDYFRWTEYGMRELLKDFDLKEIGIAWGPTTAISSVGGAWLSLIISFGQKTLYQIWLVFFIFFFAPLNRLDHLLKYHSRAIDNSHGLYFVAIKK